MEVHAKIDEADIGQIRVGQRASFTVDTYPGRTFSGTVEQIRQAPEVVENVVTYTVVLTTRNADLDLLPGMTAIIQVVVEEFEDVLKLPNAAVRFRPPRSAGARPVPNAAAAAVSTSGSPAVVWVLDEDEKPVPVRVTLGRSHESATEVVDGPLRAGQPVIIGTSAAQDHAGFGFSWRP